MYSRFKFYINRVRQYGLMSSLYRAVSRLVTKCTFHPYYYFRKGIFGYAIIRINGVKMRLDLKNDDGLSKDLMTRGKREIMTTNYLLHSNILKSGDVVLDIGGNIGYYALPEARLVGKEGKVYAVEPVTANFELLRRNIDLNGFKNVHAFQLALGDSEKRIPLYVRSKKNLSSITQLPEDASGGVERTEDVEMTTVDSFAKKTIGGYPDFIRMDVEGYEFAILSAMERTLEHRPVLLIEFHPMYLTPEQKEKICKILKQYYTKTVVTMNPKSPPKALRQFLNKKMGFDGCQGYTKELTLDQLHSLLYSSERVFNAFFLRDK